jgi:branched-chain amino acid transport system substrate-binding protein
VIGVAQSFSGNQASPGLQVQKGARVAAYHVNSLGGVLGQRIELDERDDRTEDQFAIEAADALIAKKVAAVLAPTSTKQGLAVLGKYSDAKILTATATATTKTLTSEGKYPFFFRTSASAAIQGSVFAKFVRGGEPGAPTCAKMALLWTDEANGKELSSIITAEFAKRGGTIVAPTAIPQAEQDSYDDILEATVEANAASIDCIGITGQELPFRKLLQNYRDLTKRSKVTDWTRIRIYATQAFFNPEFVKGSGVGVAENAADGVSGISQDPAPPGAESAAFRALYETLNPTPSGSNVAAPPRNAATAYDAVVMMALAIQKAGGTKDRDALRAAVTAISGGEGGTPVTPANLAEGFRLLRESRPINYRGATGSCDLDANGDVKKVGFIVWSVTAGVLSDPLAASRIPEEAVE